MTFVTVWCNSSSELIQHPTEGVRRVLVVIHPQAYIHSQTSSVLHLCTSPTQLLVSYDFCVLQPSPLYSYSGSLVEGESTIPSTSSWLAFHLLHGHCSNHESDKYEILRNGWPALATEYHAGIHPSVTNSAQFILDMPMASS